MHLHAAAGSQERDDIVRLSPAALGMAVRQADEVERGVWRQLAHNSSLRPAAWQHDSTEGSPVWLLCLQQVDSLIWLLTSAVLLGAWMETTR